jgi:cell wall-associated NlpC family hydrolase
VAVTAARGNFSQLSNSGWIFTDHLASIEEKEKDFVAVAERFIGVPYLWGGRESLGLDCSALVQTALERAGFHALRDSDMQEATLGEALPTPFDLTSLQRGDLIFWKGHVGIMQDGERFLHANATHMCTRSEPFLEAVARIAKTDGDITSIRRMPSLGA